MGLSLYIHEMKTILEYLFRSRESIANATDAREAALVNAADSPVDGNADAWIQIAPYGTYPGSRPGRPQHFTEAEANSMVAEFTSLHGQAGRLWRGIHVLPLFTRSSLLGT